MKAPIVSRKHIVQHTQFTTASLTVTTFEDVIARAVQDVNAPNEVVEGSVIKNVYIEIWLISDSLANPSATFVMFVEKATGQSANPTISDMTTLDAYRNKKNILYTTQGLLPEEQGNPVPLLRQWIKVPKSKQRFGLDDRFKINIGAIGAEAILGCGMSIYKSYT